jgi:hypothetical protein
MTISSSVGITKAATLLSARKCGFRGARSPWRRDRFPASRAGSSTRGRTSTEFSPMPPQNATASGPPKVVAIAAISRRILLAK